MTDRVTLRQLRAFQAVMSTGSVTIAAERLNLTQPAVSKQLTALEDALNIRLFHRRSGSTLSPSREGLEFFRHVERTIFGLDDIQSAVERIARGKSRHLDVAGTPPLINSSPVMRAVKAHLEVDPSTHLRLDARHRLEIEDWILRRQIDIGLALLPPVDGTLASIPLVETRAVAAMPHGHPLAARSEITLRDLKEVRVILPSKQPLRDKIDAAFALRDERIFPGIETSSAINCCRLASQGLGVAICDPFSPDLFGPELATRPVAPKVPLVYGILLSDDTVVVSHCAAFVRLLRSEFDTWRQNFDNSPDNNNAR